LTACNRPCGTGIAGKPDLFSFIVFFLLSELLRVYSPPALVFPARKNRVSLTENRRIGRYHCL
jgi:hypothetical protein